ncbi:hypothetical protein ACIB24_22895 [Spongisporangium articulatum]|uniref:Uncharacterized protein n=1 Tax=Spongisporangium articulatum TaxID=3362603 RepID=A0ABW8AVA8_9ACTN
MSEPDDVDTATVDDDEYAQDLADEERERQATRGRTNVAVNDLTEDDPGDEAGGEPDDPYAEPTPEQVAEMDRASEGGRI